MKSPVTTHVLDTARGTPAAGVEVTLEYGGSSSRAGEWSTVAAGKTDSDGRIMDWMGEGEALKKGIYRITFETGAYFGAFGGKSFYPYAQIVFEIREPGGHYHVPLLLSPYGYSTYRGS